ncbi:hypothetical protein NLG97_g1595 [Lecanicillium saksenae]|uniref:Uncharacterized protein n=1 Tax=Lecanicillium saksenae TaxID=468837 RepID=A0ACC1R3B2_9HYPO|nr:hypothetical protein NLG97_g1595 [Lecanicillium saksenae]
MLFNLSTVKALGIASVLGTALGSPMGNSDAVATLDRRIVGNEAETLLCVAVGNSKCGLWVTYTNGQSRQTVKYESGGTTGCAFGLLQKHTNDAGFWADLNIFGSAGMNIGYNPTGASIALGKSTWSSEDQSYLQGRCLNEFGWKDTIDTSKSTDAFYGDMSQKLF